MTKYPILAILVATTTCVSAPSIQACGDKLVPLGGGVRFEQIHVSRYPGKIILFLNPSSTLRTANDEFGLSAALVRAGHAVSTVEDVQQLEAALQTGNPDLVLMDWADVVQLHDEVQSEGGSPPICRAVPPDCGAAASRPRADPLRGTGHEAQRPHGRRSIRRGNHGAARQRPSCELHEKRPGSDAVVNSAPSPARLTLGALILLLMQPGAATRRHSCPKQAASPSTAHTAII